MTRTSSILFWFSLIIAASLGLYRTSDRVAELDRQLRDTNVAIDAEKQSIHVLTAEWGYLTNPERVEAASHRHLALRPTAPAQIATLNTLQDVLPTRGEAMAAVAVSATPMATIKTLAARAPAAPTLFKTAAFHPAKAKLAGVVSLDSAHLRDHMVMVQHTASAAPVPGDSIGALIQELGTER